MYISSYRAERWERRRRRLNPSVSVSWRDATCLLYTHLKHFLKDRWGWLTLARGFLNLDFTLAMEKDLLGLWQSTYLVQSKECRWQKKIKCVFVSCLFSRQEYEAIKMNKKCQLRSMSEKHNFKNPHQIKSNYTWARPFFLKQLCVYDLVDELVYGQENQISLKNIGFFFQKEIFLLTILLFCMYCVHISWLNWIAMRFKAPMGSDSEMNNNIKKILTKRNSVASQTTQSNPFHKLSFNSFLSSDLLLKKVVRWL